MKDLPSPVESLPATTVRPILQLRGIGKYYGAVHALRGASLDLLPGQVTALVGDNGAGKSTLVKVLTGVIQPDEGQIVMDEATVRLHSPRDAVNLGIAAVFQDLALCDNLSVVENLFLGREETRDGWVRPRLLRRTDTAAMEHEVRDLFASLHVNIPHLRMAVEALSGGQRQSIAIARALLGAPRVVILDEPTAALSIGQTAEVLSLVERLRAAGRAVLIISHNLADVFRVADVISVLRLGENAGNFRAGDGSQEEVVAAITGAEWGKMT
jgi:D-xylose transport system ATP-binding protein